MSDAEGLTENLSLAAFKGWSYHRLTPTRTAWRFNIPRRLIQGFIDASPKEGSFYVPLTCAVDADKKRFFILLDITMRLSSEQYLGMMRAMETQESPAQPQDTKEQADRQGVEG